MSAWETEARAQRARAEKAEAALRDCRAEAERHKKTAAAWAPAVIDRVNFALRERPYRDVPLPSVRVELQCELCGTKNNLAHANFCDGDRSDMKPVPRASEAVPCAEQCAAETTQSCALREHHTGEHQSEAGITWPRRTKIVRRPNEARQRTCENPSTCREGTVFRLVGDGVEARFCVKCDQRYETRAAEEPCANEAPKRCKVCGTDKGVVALGAGPFCQSCASATKDPWACPVPCVDELTAEAERLNMYPRTDKARVEAQELEAWHRGRAYAWNEVEAMAMAKGLTKFAKKAAKRAAMIRTTNESTTLPSQETRADTSSRRQADQEFTSEDDKLPKIDPSWRDQAEHLAEMCRTGTTSDEYDIRAIATALRDAYAEGRRSVQRAETEVPDRVCDDLFFAGRNLAREVERLIKHDENRRLGDRIDYALKIYREHDPDVLRDCTDKDLIEMAKVVGTGGTE